MCNLISTSKLYSYVNFCRVAKYADHTTIGTNFMQNLLTTGIFPHIMSLWALHCSILSCGLLKVMAADISASDMKNCSCFGKSEHIELSIGSSVEIFDTEDSYCVSKACCIPYHRVFWRINTLLPEIRLLIWQLGFSYFAHVFWAASSL